MRVSVHRVRRLDLPWLSLGIFGVWGVLVAVAYVAQTRGVDAPPMCNLRRITGVPCPTCGGTRAAFSLLELRVLDAVAFNPLVTVLLVATGGYVLARTLSGRGVRIAWTPPARRVAWAIFGVSLVANWVWVINRLG